MTDSPGGPALAATMRRDLTTAYLASASRLGSSVIVSALVFRFIGPAEFAMLALVRGTIGILNYTSLGLAPALIHRAAATVDSPLRALPTEDYSLGGVLPYRAPDPPGSSLQILYANALKLAFYTGAVGIAVSLLYAVFFESIYVVPARLSGEMGRIVLPLGVGTILRLASDAPGGVLQVRNQIALDNRILAAGDLLWMASTAFFVFVLNDYADKLAAVAMLYAMTGAVVFIVRIRAAGRETQIYWPNSRFIDRSLIRSLLGYGLLVVAAQLADYLYAPTDYILIDRLLTPADLAFYAPAVQIDSGLLLLVTGLSAVLLPKAALAHAGGLTDVVRAYYLRGTLVSLLLLGTTSIGVWLAAPLIFRAWFGNPMTGTQAILPLVLIGTTLGGASAVGRSVLIAVGKAKPFAISVLVAGVVNAVASYVFVRYFHRGLQGILLGTVVAVILRCVLWMPWYVLRSLRKVR